MTAPTDLRPDRPPDGDGTGLDVTWPLWQPQVTRQPWHLPGLTGLRGIAVLAVVAYHLGFLPGGFVGVDLFFVLSGFLITTLLLRDPPTGAGGIGAWWSRRMRRLTPAVAVVVLAVLVAFASRSGIALDAVATMTWWQNWHLIAQGTPYWAGTPSPLRHAWSLSIEEQFYLVWPLVLVALLALGRRLRRPALLVGGVAAVGALASFAWAALLAAAADADLSRIYFGTDTRAGALLAGCAMAAWMVRDGRGVTRRARPIPTWLGAAAVAAAAVLGALCLVLAPDVASTYRGGLVIATVASLVMIGACTGPGPVTNSLSWAPLQWLGTRSYAIYLWSWPVQVLLQERWTDLPIGIVAIITVSTSILLADLSLRLVERPMRVGEGWARRDLPRRAAWAVGLVALVALCVHAGRSTELTQDEQIAAEFEQVADPSTTTTPIAPSPESPATAAAASGAPTTTVAPTTTCVPTAAPTPQYSGGGGVFDSSTVNEIADPTGAGCGTTRVMVVGDSTGRGAANGLRRTASSTLEVWDRTVLGCGLQAAKAKCPNWRDIWPAAVQQVQPQVVLVHMGVSDDLVPGQEPGFMSAEASALRQQVVGEAMDALSATGARVVWALPAVPLDKGVFYCGGTRRNTGCDPTWIARWNADVSIAAAARGVGIVDLEDWAATRGRTSADRPDGLHFSGDGLDAEATWLAGVLR